MTGAMMTDEQKAVMDKLFDDAVADARTRWTEAPWENPAMLIREKVKAIFADHVESEDFKAKLATLAWEQSEKVIMASLPTLLKDSWDTRQLVTKTLVDSLARHKDDLDAMMKDALSNGAAKAIVEKAFSDFFTTTVNNSVTGFLANFAARIAQDTEMQIQNARHR